MTNTRIEIELAPYKLRPRGSRTYEVVLRGEVIGELQAFRRLVGRKPQTHYIVRSASGGMLGTRVNVDDAADLAYDFHCKNEAELTGAVPTADELWARELEFVARLQVSRIIGSQSDAIYALVLWRELHGLSRSTDELIEVQFEAAVRRRGGE